MKNKRKGFTLVELLVVIAILAVLATVSIIAYTSFTQKANLSNDQTMIKMVNDNLAGEAVESKPTSAKDAIEDLYTQGFSSEKLIPFSKGYHYAYSLENNKFYLLDDKDTVVFPESTVDKTTLWGLYRDEQTDKISGVTKYVAMKVVINQTNFDAVFEGTTTQYQLDLNNNYIAINGKNNIKVLNGSVKPNSSFVTDSNVVTLGKYDNTQVKDTVENVYIDINDKVKYPTTQSATFTIKNSTFDGLDSINSINLTNIPANVNHVIIENCTFINHKKWCLTVGALDASKSVKYTVRNNKFVNSTRGINVLGYNDEGTTIESNEFTLANDKKANAIQIADLDRAVEAVYATFATSAVTLKNNKMYAGNAFVVAHSSLVGRVRVQGQKAEQVDYVDAQKLDKFIAFENNQILDSKIAKVVPDPDTQSDVGHITGAPEQLQAYVDKLLTLIK